MERDVSVKHEVIKQEAVEHTDLQDTSKKHKQNIGTCDLAYRCMQNSQGRMRSSRQKQDSVMTPQEGQCLDTS